MVENRISTVLTPEDVREIMDAIATIEAKLPFLIGLSREERRSMLKMGDDGRNFVLRMTELIEQQPDFLPRSFDIDELRKDVELLKTFYPIVLKFQQLAELTDDTYMVIGSEAYSSTLLAYRYARAGDLQGADALLEEAGRRFSRRRRTTASTAEAPSEG